MIIIFVQYPHNHTYFDAAIAKLTHKTITHGGRKGLLFVMRKPSTMAVEKALFL